MEILKLEQMIKLQRLTLMERGFVEASAARPWLAGWHGNLIGWRVSLRNYPIRTSSRASLPAVLYLSLVCYSIRYQP